MSSAFAAAMDKIVADCNDRLEWVKSSKDNLTKDAARVSDRTVVEFHPA